MRAYSLLAFLCLDGMAAIRIAPLPLAWRPLATPRQHCMQYSGDTTRGLDNLGPEQQSAFVAMFSDDKFAAESLVSADTATWDRVRSSYPVLATLSDEELAQSLTSFINTPSFA